jgi:hypothetical protein
MTRMALALRRPHETIELVHAGIGYTVGLGWDDIDRIGSPVEIWVNCHKVSSPMEAMARDASIMISLALQFGVPLSKLRGSVTREDDGTPASIFGAVLDAMQQGNEK